MRLELARERALAGVLKEADAFTLIEQKHQLYPADALFKSAVLEAGKT
jgi:hypothetical protein